MHFVEAVNENPCIDEKVKIFLTFPSHFDVLVLFYGLIEKTMCEDSVISYRSKSRNKFLVNKVETMMLRVNNE